MGMEGEPCAVSSVGDNDETARTDDDSSVAANTKAWEDVSVVAVVPMGAATSVGVMEEDGLPIQRGMTILGLVTAIWVV